MSEAYLNEDCEGMTLVDAENAFNSVNREAVLNVRSVCPPFYQFLNNIYQEPSKLIISGAPNGTHLSSKEGTIQGDGADMPMYSCAIKPLMAELVKALIADDSSLKGIQAWFADDSACAGRFLALRAWWDMIVVLGPKYGCIPKPSKCHLIMKSDDLLEAATSLFSETGINLTVNGERHLGAVVGSLDTWLIPALVGRDISDTERRMFALPLRFGGLRITNPVGEADAELACSMSITALLIRTIQHQSLDISAGFQLFLQKLLVSF